MTEEWTLENENHIQEPFTYLFQKPGKDMRVRHIEAFNAVLNVDKRDASMIGYTIQQLHTSSLLIDDIEDSATLRRGAPVAHKVYGVPLTINAANYSMVIAMSTVLESLGPVAGNILSQELLMLHQGQGMDLYWRDNHICPSEEQYLMMVRRKTAGLYRLAVRLMQHKSESKVDLIPLADIFGTLYQIQDDYLNLQSSQYASKKGYCEDLTEGKFSFPIIHCIRSNPENTELSKILRQRTTDHSLKEYALKLMADAGSFDYTRKVISEYVKKGHQFISVLPIDEPARNKLYDLLTTILHIE